MKRSRMHYLVGYAIAAWCREQGVPTPLSKMSGKKFGEWVEDIVDKGLASVESDEDFENDALEEIERLTNGE